MGNQQVSTSRRSAGEANRELARFALTAGDFDHQYMARKFSLSDAAATKAELDRSTVPLHTIEPKLNGALTAKLRANINTIGAKIRPDLSDDQAQSWVNAMIIALSDLPPQVAAKASERALHIAFIYPSEVEAKIRELADEHLGRIAQASRRLAMVMNAINEALHPLTQKIEDNRPPEQREKALPDDEVHDLQRMGGMGLQIVKLGLRIGYIKPEQLLPADDQSMPREDNP